MAIVVEDGTGKPDAETLCSVAAFRAYCDGRGLSLVGVTDARVEQLLRQANDYLLTFSGVWKGYRLTATQALDWPRVGVVVNCYELPSSVIPPAVINAAAALAFKAQTGPLMPDVRGIAVKKLKLGPLEKEFDTATAPGNSSAPRYPEISRLLAGLFNTNATNPYMVPLRRS